VPFRIAAPKQCGPDQVPHRIKLILGAERALCIGNGGLPELQKRGTYLLEACASSQLGISKVPGLSCLTLRASCKAWTCWTSCGFAE